MFDKLIGKKKKEGDWFVVPERKYTTDQKAISKMSSSGWKDVYEHQEKYIALLVEKLECGKSEYERANEKIDEMQEKNQVVNGQISRMTNEHEELTIKFDNLQTSLNYISSDNDQLYKKEVLFLQEQQVACEKIKNLNGLVAFYRERFVLCRKIEQQNKSLKQRYSELEESYEESQGKLKQFEKDKNFNSLIPSLMQEIQQLKKNQGKGQINASDIENHFNKFEKQLVQKMKGELQTASTIKSTEEEELEEGNRVMSIELKRVQADVAEWKKRYDEVQEKYQENCLSLGRLSEQIKSKEGQVIKLKESNSAQYEKIQRLIAENNEMKKENSSLDNNRRVLQNNLSQIKIESMKLQARLQESKAQLDTKQKAYEKVSTLLVQNEKQLQHYMKELSSERENRKAMQTVFSNQNNSEVESLLKIKSKIQQQNQQLKQNIEALKKQITDRQSKIKKLQTQIDALKNSNKRLGQQKLLIQENANTCLKISQQELSKLREWQVQAKRQIDEQRRQLQLTLMKLSSSQDENKNFKTETQKLFKTLQSKQAELKKNYSTIQQLQKAKSQINDMIGEKQQDSKIRMRKYQSQLNQQRIKIQSYHRKINALETKIEENKISMDNMYEQLLSKDKKIVHMETKLKEYKYIIQVQKKEKQEIEESYERTINSLKPNEMRKQELNEKENVPEKGVEKVVDHEKDNLKNQILSIRQQNIVLLSENESLRKKIEQLQQTIQEKSRNIRLLQQKRDQIMKQIQKMNKKAPNASNQPPSLHNLPSPKAIRIQSKDHESRQKKIAAKAHKGFDILIKLQHQLYKDFITVFAGQLSRDQVKNIQGGINNLVKKSIDMRDIFEDYL